MVKQCFAIVDAPRGLPVRALGRTAVVVLVANLLLVAGFQSWPGRRALRLDLRPDRQPRDAGADGGLLRPRDRRRSAPGRGVLARVRDAVARRPATSSTRPGRSSRPHPPSPPLRLAYLGFYVSVTAAVVCLVAPRPRVVPPRAVARRRARRRRRRDRAGRGPEPRPLQPAGRPRRSAGRRGLHGRGPAPGRDDLRRCSPRAARAADRCGSGWPAASRRSARPMSSTRCGSSAGTYSVAISLSARMDDRGHVASRSRSGGPQRPRGIDDPAARGRSWRSRCWRR